MASPPFKFGLSTGWLATNPKVTARHLCMELLYSRWATFTAHEVDNAELDIDNVIVLERVDKFCYLYDMLEADERHELALKERIKVHRKSSSTCLR